jgi:hypothetical protein
MAGEMAPPVPPPAYQSSQQLSLPLPVPLGAPLRRGPAPVPAEVGPQQVWPHLGPAARTRVRQAFARILREVLHDGAGAQR